MVRLRMSVEFLGEISVIMGFQKHLVIELKVFALTKDGSFMLINERRWKLVKEMRLGIFMVQWFAKTLENCLKGEKKDFLYHFKGR